MFSLTNSSFRSNTRFKSVLFCIPLFLAQGCANTTLQDSFSGLQEAVGGVIGSGSNESGAQCSGPKATIAIADFENKTNFNRRASLALSDKLGQQLLKTGCFQVADRKRMREIMQEMGMSQSGLVQAGSAARFGKMIGVDLLVFGSITQYTTNPSRDRDSRVEETARIEANINMTGVESGRIVISETVSGSGLKIASSSPLMAILQTQSTADKAADDMLEKAVEAIVAGIPGNFSGRSVRKAKPKDPNALLAQRAMREAGFYDGAIDGDIGPKSIAALKAFQEQFDLAVTGKLDEPTLSMMKAMFN